MEEFYCKNIFNLECSMFFSLFSNKNYCFYFIKARFEPVLVQSIHSRSHELWPPFKDTTLYTIITNTRISGCEHLSRHDLNSNPILKTPLGLLKLKAS